ncbi:MAG TPA: redoxin domain-containing protein [Pyrinomonadaceae bacterium]|nr:redoxin domain-containing protein [Pyrinomonadaceae bacterium]
MRRSSRAALAALIASLLPWGEVVISDTAAAQAPDARRILREAGDACRSVRSIEYAEEQEPVGEGGEHRHTVRAAVRQARAAVAAAGFLPGKFAVEGAILHADREPASFAFSYDGKTLRVLDASEKTIKVLRSPAPYTAGQLLGPVGMTGLRQFTEEQPFLNILERADRVEHEGTKTVHGVACHVVAVTSTVEHPALGKQTIVSRWYIGADDKLPRGAELGGVRKTLRITAVNRALPETAFVLQPRKGYGERLVTGAEPKRKGLLPVGAEAPDWKLTDPEGRAHTLSDYRGRLVLLDFWGTWCVPCLKTMPGIQSLHEKFKDRGLVVLGVTLGGDEAGDPVAFMKAHGFTYRILLKGDDISALYNVAVLPALYLVGDDGRVVHAEYGLREGAKEDLTRIIEGYLRRRGR